MLSRAKRTRGRSRLHAMAGVEVLGRRALTSYLVVAHDHAVIPVHVSDVRSNEPLFSNGLGVKRAPRFYHLYTGPRRPELNGIRASAYVSEKNLVLSGTVVGIIPRHPTSASQESLYTFGIDRGGASKSGPFPGRPHVRFDSVVVADVARKGLTAYVQLNDPRTNQPGTPIKPLPSSDVAITGNVITITVPISMLPSSGHAIDQWNVNFFTRNPAQKRDFHSVASLTPEFTSFQVYVKPPATQ
jgi:hypothetical protein